MSPFAALSAMLHRLLCTLSGAFLSTCLTIVGLRHTVRYLSVRLVVATLFVLLVGASVVYLSANCLNKYANGKFLQGLL